MHILFLTDNFYPEGNAPAARTFEHAQVWVKAGHKVTVITCAPNFPEGRVFKGYKNAWYARENIEGINVVRVKTFIAANEGFLLRTIDYLSFMLASFFGGLFQRKPDVIVATSPQFFTAVAGWLLSFIRRKPFIFELRDIWPESITAVGAMKPSRVVRWLEHLELFLYARADAIVAVTNSFKEDLVRRGINSDKIVVVFNGVDLERYKPSKEKDPLLLDKYKLHNKFIAAYIGTHGMAHGLENIVDAAEKLSSFEDVVILFIGGGAARESLRQVVAEKSLKNVIMIPRQPKEDMPRFWSLCDASLVTLKNNPAFEKVIPSKIFESMGVGVPVIAALPAGEAAGIVSKTRVGVVVDAECSEQIASAIENMYCDRTMLHSTKQRCITASHEYSRVTMAEQMLGVFERVFLRVSLSSSSTGAVAKNK